MNFRIADTLIDSLAKLTWEVRVNSDICMIVH